MNQQVKRQQSAFQFICLFLTGLSLSGCLAWGKHDMLPPSKSITSLGPATAQSVVLYRNGETPKRSCIRIAKVAAHGNAFATQATLEDAIRAEAASIGADYVVITAQEVTRDETISTYYGGWGSGSMWGTSISDSVQRPHLYGIACLNAAVRFGVQPDKDWKVQYVYRNTTADRLGIKEGDRVLAINGRFLAADTFAVDQEVLSKRPGDTITVEYLTKDGTKITKDIVLEEWR